MRKEWRNVDELVDMAQHGNRLEWYWVRWGGGGGIVATELAITRCWVVCTVIGGPAELKAKVGRLPITYLLGLYIITVYNTILFLY